MEKLNESPGHMGKSTIQGLLDKGGDVFFD